MATDILVNDENDLIIEHGDLVVGFSDVQHIDHMLRANKGDFKESPLIGIGVAKYRDASVSSVLIDKFKKDVSIQLEYDGFSNIDINTTDFKEIFINADRV